MASMFTHGVLMTGHRTDAFNGYTAPTKREIEVGLMIAHGFRGKDIARHLQISPATVKVHRDNLMRKVGVHNGVQLLMWMLQNGYVKVKEETDSAVRAETKDDDSGAGTTSEAG
jgi:DNA-binding NarL/FixJ family response regulator